MKTILPGITALLLIAFPAEFIFASVDITITPQKTVCCCEKGSCKCSGEGSTCDLNLMASKTIPLTPSFAAQPCGLKQAQAVFGVQGSKHHPILDALFKTTPLKEEKILVIQKPLYQSEISSPLEEPPK